MRRLHVFATPDGDLMDTLDDVGMNWSRCTDREQFVEVAALLFHENFEPVDLDGLLRCTVCGETNASTDEVC